MLGLSTDSSSVRRAVGGEVAGVLGVSTAPPLNVVTCGGRVVGDSVTRLVSVGVMLVES